MKICLKCTEPCDKYSRYCHTHLLEHIREVRNKNPQLHRAAHKRWQDKNKETLLIGWRSKATRRRLEMASFIEWFKDVPCTDCGLRWPPEAMDFDHVRGEKVTNVAYMAGGRYKPEVVLAEIQKCEPVCACCHRVRTRRRAMNLPLEAPHLSCQFGHKCFVEVGRRADPGA